METPATGLAEDILSSTDACVEWREYWSLEDDMPYYHNLKTNEVTWDVPEGIPTRFPTYHSRNENIRIDAEGRVQFPQKDGPLKPGEATTSPLTLKQKLALYGSGGLCLYLIIHNICLTCVFVALYVLEWDLVGLAQSYGFNIKRSDGNETVANSDGTVTIKRGASFLSTFVTAVLLNKLTVPLQIGTTLLLAPRFVPLLTPIANRIALAIGPWLPFAGHASKKVNIRPLRSA